MTEQEISEPHYRLTPEAIEILGLLYKRGAEAECGPIGYMALVAAWATVQIGEMSEEAADEVRAVIGLVADHVRIFEAEQTALYAAGGAKEVRH